MRGCSRHQKKVFGLFPGGTTGVQSSLIIDVGTERECTHREASMSYKHFQLRNDENINEDPSCPDRWFTHFYVVSVLWNGFLLIWLFRAEFLGESLPSWIQPMHRALGRDSQSEGTGKYSGYYEAAI